jgi:hypothetical protein
MDRVNASRDHMLAPIDRVNGRFDGMLASMDRVNARFNGMLASMDRVNANRSFMNTGREHMSGTGYANLPALDAFIRPEQPRVPTMVVLMARRGRINEQPWMY